MAHTLNDVHPVEHALEDIGDVMATQWRADLVEYQARVVALAAMVPGNPTAEATLRAAASFVNRAHIHLAGQKCSCRIAGWAHRDTLLIHEHAVRLLGAEAAIPFAPQWRPL